MPNPINPSGKIRLYFGARYITQRKYQTKETRTKIIQLWQSQFGTDITVVIAPDLNGLCAPCFTTSKVLPCSVSI